MDDLLGLVVLPDFIVTLLGRTVPAPAPGMDFLLEIRPFDVREERSQGCKSSGKSSLSYSGKFWRGPIFMHQLITKIKH